MVDLSYDLHVVLRDPVDHDGSAYPEGQVHVVVVYESNGYMEICDYLI